ncbi:hypothetical protein BJ875DRAFT_503925 [Amylocarpus encephaloides]|uniref:Uncharacterized protein n=1 Tax=Amylocarpus encephaloides TaxID=45428 RepID=A0A9P8C6U2_9HELO|nr:hypothetical protein BJ875DRAFT_503925 [Amylocarpus encephaloides]
MDIRNVELSIEDILSIHRHWVSKLYTEEGKSEVEIVELLYEHHLPVTADQPARFAAHSTSTVTKVTSHQTKTRTYEVQKTLSTIEKGPSPLDMFKDDTCQSHERIAVGLRRVNVECHLNSNDGKNEDFEWMRQYKEYKGMSSQRREVKILQDVTEDKHGHGGDEE